MNSSPEINALKSCIRELKGEIARYQKREEQVEDMLQRIAAITEEKAEI